MTMPLSVAATMSSSPMSLLAREQRHVRHPLELHAVPRVRERAAVRLVDARELADPRRLLARRLVVLEHALLDDEPLVGRHALVVPRHAGERTFLGAVALDVHDRRAVLELADVLLRRRDEARAREVRLVAHRAIQLGGMADGFVDREPEVARVEDQVVAPRLDRTCALSFSTASAAHFAGVAGHVERRDVFPALSARRELLGVLLKAAATDRGRRERRADADERLRRLGPFGVRVRLHLAQQLQPRGHEAHPLHLERRFVRREQQRDFLLDRHVERIARRRAFSTCL